MSVTGVMQCNHIHTHSQIEISNLVLKVTSLFLILSNYYSSMNMTHINPHQHTCRKLQIRTRGVHVDPMMFFQRHTTFTDALILFNTLKVYFVIILFEIDFHE